MPFVPEDEVDVVEHLVIYRHHVYVVHEQVDDVAFDPVVGHTGYPI